MEKPRFFCAQCSTVYDSLDDYVTHTWSFVHHVRKSRGIGDKNHVCDLCRFMCDNLADFSGHIDSYTHKTAVFLAICAMKNPVTSATFSTHHNQRPSYDAYHHQPAVQPYRQPHPLPPWNPPQFSNFGQRPSFPQTGPLLTGGQFQPYEAPVSSTFRFQSFGPDSQPAPQAHQSRQKRPFAYPQRPIRSNQRPFLLTSPLAKNFVKKAINFANNALPKENLFSNMPVPVLAEKSQVLTHKNHRINALVKKMPIERRKSVGKIQKKKSKMSDKHADFGGKFTSGLPSSTIAQAVSTTQKTSGGIDKLAQKPKRIYTPRFKQLERASGESVVHRLLANRLKRYNVESGGSNAAPPPNPTQRAAGELQTFGSDVTLVPPVTTNSAISTHTTTGGKQLNNSELSKEKNLAEAADKWDQILEKVARPSIASQSQSDKQLPADQTPVQTPEDQNIEKKVEKFDTQNIIKNKLPVQSKCTENFLKMEPDKVHQLASSTNSKLKVEPKVEQQVDNSVSKLNSNSQNSDQIDDPKLDQKSKAADLIPDDDSAEKIGSKLILPQIKSEVEEVVALNAVEYMVGSEKRKTSAVETYVPSHFHSSTEQINDKPPVSASAYVEFHQPLPQTNGRGSPDRPTHPPSSIGPDASSRLQRLWDICKQEQQLKKDEDQLNEEICSMKIKLEKLRRSRMDKQKELEQCQAAKNGLLLVGDATNAGTVSSADFPVIDAGTAAPLAQVEYLGAIDSQNPIFRRIHMALGLSPPKGRQPKKRK